MEGGCTCRQIRYRLTGDQLAADRADGSRGNCLVDGGGDDRAGDHEDREDRRKSEHSEDNLQSSQDRTHVFYAARSAGKRDKRIVFPMPAHSAVDNLNDG